MKRRECISYIGGLKMTASKVSAGDLRAAEWLQATPGERFRIRTSVTETEGAYSMLEFAVDPRNSYQKYVLALLPLTAHAACAASPLEGESNGRRALFYLSLRQVRFLRCHGDQK